MNGQGEQPNTALQLTNTDAAQSAILSLCLLSALAAECHVVPASEVSRLTARERAAFSQ